MARGSRALRGIFGEMLDKLLGKVKTVARRGSRGAARELEKAPRMSRAEAREAAQREARAYADELRQRPRSKRPTASTAAVDRRTGRAYRGASGEARGKHGLEPVEVDPRVRERLPPEPTPAGWPAENCGEIPAASRAARDGADLDDLEYYTVRVKDGSELPLCPNCQTWIP